MNFIKQNLSKLTTATLLTLIGLLCIIAGSVMHVNSTNIANVINELLLALGIPTIVISSIALLISLGSAVITTNEQSFAVSSITSGATLAAGIFIIASSESTNLIYAFISYVPYFLMVEGAVLFIDSLFNLFYGYVTKKNKPALYAFITEVFISLTAIIIGCISITLISKEIQLIIFGIILIIYALFLVLGMLSIIPTEEKIAQIIVMMISVLLIASPLYLVRLYI